MTILEQKFYETVPIRLKGIEAELQKLNRNFFILFSSQKNGEGKTERKETSNLSDSLLSDSMPQPEETFVKDAEQAAEMLRPKLQNLDHEELWALYLNNDAKYMGMEMICKGTITSTLTDCRRIVSEAIRYKATSVIVFHNHPSNNVRPSETDIRTTKDIRSSLKVFDITLTDHIIIGARKFYSFAAGETINFKTNNK